MRWDSYNGNNDDDEDGNHKEINEQNEIYIAEKINFLHQQPVSILWQAIHNHIHLWMPSDFVWFESNKDNDIEMKKFRWKQNLHDWTFQQSHHRHHQHELYAGNWWDFQSLNGRFVFVAKIYNYNDPNLEIWKIQILKKSKKKLHTVGCGRLVTIPQVKHWIHNSLIILLFYFSFLFLFWLQADQDQRKRERGKATRIFRYNLHSNHQTK